MANLWRQTCFQHITAGQVGFTENEVSGLCDRYGIDPDEVKNWYDGYSLGDDLSVYSPRSVVNCMQFGKVANYWNQTESFEALKLYIDMNFDGLRDDVLSMIAGEPVPVNTGSFTNDMTTFRTEDDVLTLLIHLGYLAYDEKNRAAFIPNNEIRSEYVNAVSASDWGSIMIERQGSINAGSRKKIRNDRHCAYAAADIKKYLPFFLDKYNVRRYIIIIIYH